jgi:type II secretory pathway pseudopilin PulG
MNHLQPRRKRGFTLLDLLFGMFVLAVGSLSLAALLPVLSRSGHLSHAGSQAVQIASRQIEQLRIVKYENLVPEVLLQLGLVDTIQEDPETGEVVMRFSRIPGDDGTQFRVSSLLRDGIGEVRLEEPSPNVREVKVTVRWRSESGRPQEITLTTLVGRF